VASRVPLPLGEVRRGMISFGITLIPAFSQREKAL